MELFHRQHPDIVVQFTALGESADPYSLASTADVILLHQLNNPTANKIFLDLQPLIEANPNFQPEDFWPGALAACQDIDDHIIGIPLYIGISGIFFDASAFDAAGLPTPNPGWTWDDFRHAVAGLARTEWQASPYVFIDYSSLRSSVLGPQVDAVLEQTGGEIYVDILAETVQWYFDLAQKKAIFPLGKKRDTWQTMFQTKERPAMWVGELDALMPGSPQNAPLAGQLTDLAIAYDRFVPFPIDTERSEAHTTPAWAECVRISAGTSHPQAAWTWVDFLSRQELFEDQTIEHIPARQSIAEAAGFWDALPAYAEPAVRFGLEHAWYGSKQADSFNAINQALLKIAAGDIDVPFALTAAKEEAARASVPRGDETPVFVATPQPTASSDAVTIRYYAVDMYEPETIETIRALSEAFHQSHPDIFVDPSGIFNDFASGVSPLTSLAEHFDCITYYTPARDEWNTDSLLSLDNLLEAEGTSFSQDFSAEQLNVYRFEGELFGLPAAIRAAVMSYNADLLARHGLKPPSNDWTFDEFLQMASAAANTSESAKSYGYLWDVGDSLLLEGHGVQWADFSADPPSVYLDSPEMVSALVWLDELTKAGVLLPQMVENMNDIDRAIASGQVAFWMSQAGNPQGRFFLEKEDPTFKIGIAPLPSIQNRRLFSGNYVGHFISRYSEHPQACWAWIKFLSERPNAVRGVPSRHSLAFSPAWEAFVGGSENAAVYRTAAERVMQDDIHVWEAPIYIFKETAIKAIVLKGRDFQAALAESQRKADTYLACISSRDISELDYVGLLDMMETCATQADPMWANP